MKISIPAFERNNHVIPVRYTALGENVSPRVKWSDVPEGTEEFALICEDPDAPSPEPFVHWIVYGLSANTTNIPEGLLDRDSLELPIFARQGKNSMLKAGYTGPNPPFFHGPHRYVFRLFALRQPMPLQPGAGREEFLKELEGKVIAETSFQARFEKSPGQKARAAGLWFGGLAAGGLAGWLVRRLRSSRGKPPVVEAV